MRAEPRTPASQEAELVERARSGCRDAFRELVLRYQAGVLTYLGRRLPAACDAEDVAQDVFLRAWRGLESYDARWRFRTWLYAIAHRARIDHLRRRPPVPETIDVDVCAFSTERAPEEVAEARDEARRLWCLAERELSTVQLDALWLRYVEDLTAREIGEILGRSAIAVRLLLLRSRRTLAARAGAPGLDTSSGPSDDPHVGTAWKLLEDGRSHD